MNKMRLGGTLAALALLMSLSACGEGETSSNGDDGNDSPITVPVTKTDKDPAYKVGPTAAVINEEYSDGNKGTVTISASTSSKEPDSNDHFLSIQVVLKSGGTIDCSESRSHVWSEFGAFEEVPIPCDEVLDLNDIKSVRVVP